jgi:hypothetical protein
MRTHTTIGSTIIALLLTSSIGGVVADAGVVGGVSARRGGTFGVAIGAGHLGCSVDGDDCDGDGASEAAGISVHGGATVGPALAVIGELWLMGHTEDNVTTSQGILTADLRFWAAPGLWLQGGLGFARSAVRYDGDLVDTESRSDTVPAVTAGLGLELISSATFGLDVQLKAGTGLYEDDMRIYNLSLGVGANWY